MPKSRGNFTEKEIWPRRRVQRACWVVWTVKEGEEKMLKKIIQNSLKRQSFCAMIQRPVSSVAWARSTIEVRCHALHSSRGGESVGLNFALLSKQIVAFQFKYTRNLPFSL